MPEKKKTNRAPAGAGSISKRKDDIWQGSVAVGINPATGKPMRKYVYASSEKECVKKLRALQAAIDGGTYREPSKLTVGQWLDMWTADYLGAVKPGTVESYKYHVERNIKPALGSAKLQKLAPHHIQSLYNDLQRKSGLSPKTIKNLHGVLHKAFKQAVALGYLQRNPADSVVLPRIEKAEMKTMQEDDLLRFLQAIAGHQFENLYFVTVFTGMRRGEVMGLTWDCVDFERGFITVNKQLVRNRSGEGDSYILASTKNDKPRRITPAPAVLARLRAEQARQEEMREQAGPMWEGNPSNLVFTTQFGKFQSPLTVYHKYKKLLIEQGLPDLRFHDLRHTYAVNALQSGDDIKSVQSNLGHHTAAFTLDTYGHVTDQMKRDSAARVERIIKEAKRKKSG
jgi:integrase